MSSTTLNISIVRDEAKFATMCTRWNELASDNPMLSWEWLYSWWEAFKPGKRLLIVVVTDQQGEMIGIAPWYKTLTRSGMRVIRALGDGKACSDYLSILCHESQRPAIEHRIADAILDPTPAGPQIGRWDWIEIEGHANEAYGAFQSTLANHGCVVYRQPMESCWITAIEPSFEAFEKNLRTSFRRKTRKATRNLTNPAVTLEIVNRSEGLEESRLEKTWQGFCELHQKRRASLGQPGCFFNPQFERFLKSAVYRMMPLGKLEIASVRVDGSEIASELLLRSPTHCWKYQSGMDPAASQWEPGHLLMTAVITHLIEQGCTTYDFLRGDEPYKQFWNAQPRALFRTRIVARHPAANLRHQLWLAGKNVKHNLNWLRTTVQQVLHPTR